MVVQGLHSGLLHIYTTGAKDRSHYFFVDGIKVVIQENGIRLLRYFGEDG